MAETSSRFNRRRGSGSTAAALLAIGAVTFGGVSAALAFVSRRRSAVGSVLDSLTEDTDTLEEREPQDEEPGTRITDKTEASPDQLREVKGTRISLEKKAADAVEDLIAAARSDGVAAPLLTPISGFRSPKRQEELWRRGMMKYAARLKAKLGRDPTPAEVTAETRKWVAPPGNSSHQTGRAVDLNLGTPIRSEAAAAARLTVAWKWLDANAGRFGFVPYEPEPWHWEYNPTRGA